MANDKESTTKDEVLLSDRLSDKTQNDVVDTSPSTSDTSSTKAKKPKSSGNGLLWFVVLMLFASVIAMAGAGYWYYMQQVSTSQTITAAQQTNTNQIKAMESERATLSAALRDATKSNSELEKAITELQTQNANLALQTESALEQIKNMEGRRPADWLIAEADYLVRMAGRKLWLESDVRTAILLLVNADKRLKSLADPSVLPVRAALAEDIQTQPLTLLPEWFRKSLLFTLMKNWAVAECGSCVRAIAIVPISFATPLSASFSIGSFVSF